MPESKKTIRKLATLKLKEVLNLKVHFVKNIEMEVNPLFNNQILILERYEYTGFQRDHVEKPILLFNQEKLEMGVFNKAVVKQLQINEQHNAENKNTCALSLIYCGENQYGDHFLNRDVIKSYLRLRGKSDEQLINTFIYLNFVINRFCYIKFLKESHKFFFRIIKDYSLMDDIVAHDNVRVTEEGFQNKPPVGQEKEIITMTDHSLLKRTFTFHSIFGKSFNPLILFSKDNTSKRRIN